MSPRIEQELALLRRYFPDLEYRAEGQWVRLPRYILPGEIWNRNETEVCFQILPGHPAQPPYGFFVPTHLQLKSGAAVLNRVDSAEPPFPGSWAKFSWSLPEWRPTADLQSGTNLFNFAASFQARFAEGA
jgi:hypothetical protein